MSPPLRTVDGPYHYHVYDYDNSAPFTASPGQLSPSGQFYSMVQDLQGLYLEGRARRVPNIAVGNTGGETLGGRYTKVLSFGNPSGPTVIFTGGIHSREWIAAEMAYLIAEYLIIHYTAQPTNDPYERRIKELVDSRNILIAPMLNPDGNWWTIFGTGKTDGVDPPRWRKNRRPLPQNAAEWNAALTVWGPCNTPFRNVVRDGPTVSYQVPSYLPGVGRPAKPAYLERLLLNKKTGVDLNRNCSTGAFGYDCSPGNYSSANSNPASESYFGPERGAERETHNILLLLYAHPPAVMIDYHSSGQFILYPTEAFNTKAVNGQYKAFGETLQSLILTQPQGGQQQQQYKLGSVFTLYGYDGTGALADYASQAYWTRAIVIELDPPELGGKNPPEDQIRTVFEKNIRGALATLAVPTVETRDTLVQEFLAWDVYGQGNQLPKWPK